MRKKMITGLVCSLLFGAFANAQFHHSVGGGLLYGTGKSPAGASEFDEKPTILGYGIFYYPRYNISETESGAISVGLPLIVGLSGSVNSREGGSMSITADLPVTIDYNFGGGATDESEGGFGGFVGAGFGYTYTNQTYDYVMAGTTNYEQLKGTTYGPLLHAGIKAMISDRTYFLRLFGKMGLEKEKFKTFGISVGVAL